MSRFTFLGRFVQGDAHKAQPQRKDQRTGQLKFRKNGEPDCPFYIALAIPKDPAARLVIQGVPDFDSQRALVDADARAAWPQFFGQRPAGLVFGPELAPDCINPKFANKFIDGDGFDDQGKPYSRYEGWAGHWVIKFQNGYAPALQEWVENWVDPMRPGSPPYTGWKELSVTGRTIKCGDYISVGGTCESNKSTDSPGMYMNVDTIGFEKEGDLIVSNAGVDADTALGSRGGAASPNVAPAASPAAPAPGGPTSQTAPAYDGYRTTAAPAAPAPAAPAPAAPAAPQMTAKATTTYEAYKAAGWTDDQLRAEGLLV